MKFTKFVLLLLTIPSLSFAADQAGYYRMWQGFRKPTVSSREFQRQLPGFMQSTVDVYGGVLNQYLVAVPPADKPSFVPDEFALVALDSEDAYQRIRGTPEGKAYGESHWQLFDRSNSSSAPYENFFPLQPRTLKSGQAYDMIGRPVNWNQGFTTFYIGLRKGSESFLTRLSNHVRDVAHSFHGKGLRGYLVIANENYEAAYMNWDSKEDMQAAFASPEGKAIAADAGEFMEALQWSEAEDFNGSSVATGRFYSTGRLIP